jgi:hypothetical protein
VVDGSAGASRRPPILTAGRNRSHRRIRVAGEGRPIGTSKRDTKRCRQSPGSGERCRRTGDHRSSASRANEGQELQRHLRTHAGPQYPVTAWSQGSSTRGGRRGWRPGGRRPVCEMAFALLVTRSQHAPGAGWATKSASGNASAVDIVRMVKLAVPHLPRRSLRLCRPGLAGGRHRNFGTTRSRPRRNQTGPRRRCGRRICHARTRDDSPCMSPDPRPPHSVRQSHHDCTLKRPIRPASRCP